MTPPESHAVIAPSGPANAAAAVRNAHAWFEVNSGWAPPDPDTMAEWLADGLSLCPDGCVTEPEACCRHGLASWHLVLAHVSWGRR